jgi:hypothetical protein
MQSKQKKKKTGDVGFQVSIELPGCECEAIERFSSC